MALSVDRGRSARAAHACSLPVPVVISHREQPAEKSREEKRREEKKREEEDGPRLVPIACAARRVIEGLPGFGQASIPTGYRLQPVNESCLIGVGSPRLRPPNGIELYPMQPALPTT